MRFKDLSPQFHLMTLHQALSGAATSVAGGFIGGYLLQLGFGVASALLVYASILGIRFMMRFGALLVVRALGMRRTLLVGALFAALQFVPLSQASHAAGLLGWIVLVSAGESLYWPVYHAAVAVTGLSRKRGMQMGVRQAISGTIAVIGPMAGGMLFARFGPDAAFAVAVAFGLLALIPIWRMHEIPAGSVPGLVQSLRGDRLAMLSFAADGWMQSGWGIAWGLVLFSTLQSYQALGFSNAAAGLAGVASGLVGGFCIDRGQRARLLALVSMALAAGFVCRGMAGWSPWATWFANASGAAVMGLYTPVLMTVIYERAHRSGEAFGFHFSAEAGWDMGAVAGCLAAAATAYFTGVPSLSVLPGILGVGAMYWCVQSGERALRAAAPASVGPMAGPATADAACGVGQAFAVQPLAA